MQARQAVLITDETLRAARQARRRELMAKVPRVVAPEHHAPVLWIESWITQRRERDANLQRPAAVVDAGRRFPEEVRRRVFPAAVVVHDRVELDVVRADLEL